MMMSWEGKYLHHLQGQIGLLLQILIQKILVT